MNREIKYRAWDKLNENMHEVSRLSFSRDDSERITVDSKIFENDTRFLTSKNSVLMQYTGLKDKNGNDIYEGDYLSVIIFEDNQEYKGSVVFAEGGFCLEVAMLDNKYKVPFVSFGKDIISEVIGNIYENLNLLEETK